MAYPADSPPELAEERERAVFLHAELARLPEKYRLVLTLRYLQNLSYDEIATVLGLTMGTVKTHIHRARGLLTQRLRQWEEQSAGAEDEVDLAVPCFQESGV